MDSDLDRHGRICAITIEHASQRAGAPEFTYEQRKSRSPRLGSYAPSAVLDRRGE